MPDRKHHAKSRGSPLIVAYGIGLLTLFTSIAGCLIVWQSPGYTKETKGRPKSHTPKKCKGNKGKSKGKTGDNMVFEINIARGEQAMDQGDGEGADTSQVSENPQEPKESIRPAEYIPMGLKDDLPAVEDPIFYSVKNAPEGETLSVGPFDLTANQIKDWADSTSTEDLDQLVGLNQLRPSTALTVKSAQFGAILNLLSSNQKPTEAMIQRFIPGDLQRVIAARLWQQRKAVE